MDKNARLQALASAFLERTPAAAGSDDELLSFVRVYASLYRLAAIHGETEPFGRRAEYARRAGELFPLLLHRAGERDDFVRRARFVSAAFFLSGETTFSYDARQAEACRGAALALLDDYARKERPDDLACASVCRCIADLCYPEGCGCEEWLERLADRVERWASSLDGEGRWDDADLLLALERIEVMNRYSYMFLDDGFDGAVRRAYGHYAPQVPLPERVDEASLAVLCSAYDVALQGNAYAIDRETAGRIAACLERSSGFAERGSEPSGLGAEPAPTADVVGPAGIAGSAGECGAVGVAGAVGSVGAAEAAGPVVRGTRLWALALVLDRLCELLIDERQREMMG